MKVGRDEFLIDPALQEENDERYEDGKGLIGGDPSRRPTQGRPIPESQPYFRLMDISPEKRARLDMFLQARPLEVEVGFGSGEFLVGRAAVHRDRHFLGFEVKRHLCRAVVRRTQREGLDNLWAGDEDARWVLPQLNLAGRVEVMHVLFPDPWWKRKHQAKRLFRTPFVALVSELLVPGGLLHVRTDVDGYAQMVEMVIGEFGSFSRNQPELASAFDEHPPTRREEFCRSIGRPFWVLAFQRQGQEL